MKRITKLLAVLLLAVTVSSCGVNGSGNLGGSTSSGSGNGDGCEICTGNENLTLDAVNDYFKNDPKWEDLNAYGNKVTLIPFTHINGPRYEWDFFAVINYEYNAKLYYKYQVTFLSCTCRTADVNYWQTMYVELSTPKNPDDIKVRTISFDNDSTGHYIGGFWGDSGVNGYDINGTGMTYEGIKNGFIPFLVGKTKAQLSQYSVYDDINEEEFNSWAASKNIQISLLDPNNPNDDGTYPELEPQLVTYDMFGGSSVSTNNLIRVLNSLLEYHATKI